MSNDNGSGTFVQSGGTHTTDQLVFARSSPSANGAFLRGVSTVTVQAGGAVIDSNGFGATMASNLMTDPNLNGTTDGGLTKLGAGSLRLTGANTYTGPTAVEGGTLVVNGSLGSPGMVTVASGATLAGRGTVAGAVSVQAGGTFAPGELGAGRLTLQSSLAFDGASTAAFTLGVTGATQALVAGQINLGTAATLSLNLTSGYTPAAGTRFFLLDETGSSLVVGGCANAPLSGSLFTVDGVTFQINYQDHDPNDASNLLFNDVSVLVVAVPEPFTWVLLGFGSAGLVGLARHRRVACG